MQSQTITLKPKDGSSMNAYVSLPEKKGPFAVIIVLQEAFGVNRHIRAVADRIAAEGWLAIAPELYHRSAGPGFETGYQDFELVRPHAMAVKLEGLSADLTAVYDWIQTQENTIGNKIGSIGFCMGGRVSFIANALLPLSAAVSYYGSNMPPEMAKNLHGPQLFFWGGLDKHILPDQIEGVVNAVKTAGKEYINVVVSYADHGFNCDERASYQPKAASEAWALTLSFLRNNIQSG
jgi:carboxymethylenebutenolidase